MEVTMPAGWTVTEQSQQLDIGTDGRSRDSLIVEYENTDGTIRGRITVPLDDRAADTFTKLFADRVALHERIATT